MKDRINRKFRLFLVEDSLLDVKLVEQALSESLFLVELILASDGEAALRQLKDEANARPDLVLLDLNLPLVNGLEVLAELRADPRFEFLPIVVYTTSSADDQIRLAYKRRANAYIRKPIDAIEFMDCIKSLLDFWLKTATLPPGEA